MDLRDRESNRAMQQNQSSRNTKWGSVLIAIGAGILAGAQVGKAHIALPSIRDSFALSLVDASWILSAISFVGLFVATPIGSMARRIGTKRTMMAGLLIMSAASFAGGFSSGAEGLVVSRFIEGLGFVMVIVAAPSLIVEMTERRHVRIALAGWAAFMPGGVAIATLLAPFILARHTWRAVWIADAAILALYAFLFVRLGVHQSGRVVMSSKVHPWRDFAAVIAARDPVLLAAIFGLYTLLHLGVMGLLPTILIENYRIQPSNVGLFVSIAMASNILGNLAAGVLLQKGVSRSLLIGGACTVMALMTTGMFSLHLSFGVTYFCCFLFSCVGGLVPAAVISAAPFHSPSESLIPATNGLLVQGSNVGIVLGPPLISIIAARYGWGWVPALTLTAASTAIVLAIVVGRSIPQGRDGAIDRELEIGIH
jgi:MFS family permease